MESPRTKSVIPHRAATILLLPSTPTHNSPLTTHRPFGYPHSMALHAELHRHLGGAVVPRIFWRYLVRHGHPLVERFPTYEACEAFFTHPRDSLEEYLELHTVVEQVQRVESLAYFVSKLVRGAY